MNKKISLGLAIALITLIAAAAIVFTYNYTFNKFNSMISGVYDKEETYNRISELDSFIRSSYIGTLDETALRDSILSGFVAGIGDPNARYFTAAETQAMEQTDTGYTVGLGFEFERDQSGYILVTDVTVGSDADLNGLRTGDIIAAVNNTDVLHFSGGYDEAVALMNGSEGTKVKLYVKRTASDGVTEYFDVELVTKRIEIITVTSGEYDDIAGYIRIGGFNDRTDEQLKQAVDTAITSGSGSLIIDLRDNTGGSIATLQASLDVILNAGDIVTAFYRTSETVVVKTTEADVINMPIAVLVNEKTAATAELFALALKDNAGAQIIGTVTAGRGMLQETHKLGSGGSVRLSVAYLKTSSGRDFDKTGIKPDFEVKLPEGIEFASITDDTRPILDTQLIKAIEVANTF
jgi:carboxyl-terminal processing protease